MKATEIIGTAKITIDGKRVTLEDPDIFIGKTEKLFPTDEDAITTFDRTCESASKLHGVPRPLPEKPDFTKVFNV